jgi:ribosomal protein L37AE/L43A
MSYACPKCAAHTQPPSNTDGNLWHCVGCDLQFAPGTAVAAAFAHPSDFRALLDSLTSAPLTARPLRCPQCRSESFRDVRLKGYSVEACSTCGGLVLDPQETAVLRKLGSTVGGRVDSALNVIDGAGQVFQVIARLLP